MRTLNDLYIDLLQDVYYAEKSIVKALPTMIKKASAPQLADLLSAHLDETTDQVDRLEQVFQIAGVKAKAKKCHAIEGIIQEATDAMAEAEDDAVRNAAIVADAQAVEHYEMARYGTLVAWAKQLRMPEAVKLLQATLDEETAADQKLSKVSTKLNEQANKKQAA